MSIKDGHNRRVSFDTELGDVVMEWISLLNDFNK